MVGSADNSCKGCGLGKRNILYGLSEIKPRGLADAVNGKLPTQAVNEGGQPGQFFGLNDKNPAPPVIWIDAVGFISHGGDGAEGPVDDNFEGADSQSFISQAGCSSLGHA